MVYTFENPTGLNAYVAKMGKILHDELIKKWTIKNPEGEVTFTPQFDAYPLLYIKTDDRKNRMMEYNSGGNEYESKNWAEQNKCWFIQPNPASDIPGQIYEKKTQLEIYFTLNLDEVKKGITDHRADMEVRADVEAIIDRMYFVRNAKIITGIENVYKGFKYNIADDMNSWHCFKIMVDVYSFRNDQNECSI